MISLSGWSGYGLDEDWFVDWTTTKFPIHALYPMSFSDAWIETSVTASGTIEQTNQEIEGVITVDESLVRYWIDN